MAGKREIEVVIAAKEMVSGMVGKAIAAIGGFAAVTAIIYKSVNAAADAEMAQTKLAAALGHVSTALNDQAAALQKTTMFEDDTVTAAQAMAAAFTQNEESIKRITAAAADLASAKGMDLVSATELVTKSVYGEVNALGRYGIAAEGAAGSTERLEGLMKSLNAHFGGQAQAQAQTFAGSMAYMKNQFSDLLEALGGIIVKNPAVIAAIRSLGEAFGKISEYITENKDELRVLVKDGLLIFIDALAVANMWMKGFSAGLDKMQIGFWATKWAMSGFREDFKIMMEKSKEDAAENLKFWNNIEDAIARVSGAIRSAPAIGAGQPGGGLGGGGGGIAGLGGADSDAASAVGQAQWGAEGLGLFNASVMESIMLADSFETAWTKAWSMQSANANLTASVVQASQNIQNAAFQATAIQIQRLVEQHKFSVGAIGKAVMQQAKMEIYGLAAKAAVYAIFYLAYGLGLAAMGDPRSKLAFDSAGFFGSVAGTAIAAAAALNFISPAKEQTSGAGESAGTGGGTAPLSGGATAGGGNYYISLNIVNPLSDQNWDEAVENHLIPAMERAGARNVQISGNVVATA